MWFGGGEKGVLERVKQEGGVGRVREKDRVGMSEWFGEKIDRKVIWKILNNA